MKIYEGGGGENSWNLSEKQVEEGLIHGTGGRKGRRKGGKERRWDVITNNPGIMVLGRRVAAFVSRQCCHNNRLFTSLFTSLDLWHEGSLGTR